jgi:hypothetical protein
VSFRCNGLFRDIPIQIGRCLFVFTLDVDTLCELGIFIQVRSGRKIAAIKFESELSQMMTAGGSQEMTTQSEPKYGSLAFDFPASLRKAG